MGKLTLLIVGAAILGGAVLKVGSNLIAGDTASDRSESQADLLSRQIAESGQSVALAAMVGETGFRQPGITQREYDGGSFTVTVDALAADSSQVTVTVVGTYGGAEHTIQSTYAFDAMEYPGPIWLDVPYATAAIQSGARISGTPGTRSVQYDARPFAALQLSRSLNEGAMRSALLTQVKRSASGYPTSAPVNYPTPAQWAPNGALLEDLSRQNDISSGEALYQAVVAAIQTPRDRTFGTAKTVSGTETWGAQGAITRVQGDLTVQGRLTGSGALIVEGTLNVLASARMQWNGIVIVRSTQQLLPVLLDGDADIVGGLVVVQQAYPPGGHLDLTVMRDPSGMGAPQGRRGSPNWPAQSPVDYAWWEHTHQFDEKPLSAPRGDRVVFAQNGRGPHEAETTFWDLMQTLGSEPVRLEFRHPENHGFARFTLGLRTMTQPLEGSVRSGFATFAEPGAPFKTQAFPASDLQTLVVDIQTLRAMQQRFDGEGSCSGGQWPFCIGRDWNRASALSVRVVRVRGNATLYDAALYWHMRSDEVAAHRAREDAWAATLAGGSGFGTRLTMGPKASVTYRLQDVSRLAETLGFDGNEVTLVSTQSSHVSPGEARVAVPPPADPTSLTLCHKGKKTKTYRNVSEYRLHLVHSTPGACRVESGDDDDDD